MLEIDCSGMRNYEDFVAAFNKYLAEPYAVRWNGEIAALGECLLCIEKDRCEVVIRGSDRCKAVMVGEEKKQGMDALWSRLTDVFHQNREWLTVRME